MIKRIITVTFLLLVTSCGIRTESKLSESVRLSQPHLFKLAFVPSDALERTGQVYGAMNSRYREAQFCAIQADSTETCYESQKIKTVGSKSIYRITGNVTVNASLRLAVKGTDENGLKLKRVFSFQRQNERLRDRLENGFDRIQQRLTPLPADKGNFELTSAAGQKTSLKELFKTPYMLIEASSPGCGGCVQMAQMMNGNSQRAKQIHSLFDSGKCSKAIIVSGMDSWKRKFPASTYVGKYSFTTGRSPMSVLRSFGYKGNAIPAFILVNRSFEIIDRSEGSLPREIYNKCK